MYCIVSSYSTRSTYSILMITLVSSKFLAMNIIKLYSVYGRYHRLYVQLALWGSPHFCDFKSDDRNCNISVLARLRVLINLNVRKINSTAESRDLLWLNAAHRWQAESHVSWWSNENKSVLQHLSCVYDVQFAENTMEESGHNCNNHRGIAKEASHDKPQTFALRSHLESPVNWWFDSTS